MVPEYEMDRLRELIVRNYRVIYALSPDAETVHVFAVRHGSLNLRRQLGDSPWDRMT